MGASAVTVYLSPAGRVKMGWALLAVGAVDGWLSLAFVIEAGAGYEGNPIMRALFAFNQVPAIAFKVTSALLAAVYVPRASAKWAWAMLAVGLVACVADVAAWAVFL